MWPLSAGLRVIRRWRPVGSCVALVGIFVNLIVGLSVGPNAVLALLIGQNNREEINRTLHTVITFGAALGVGLMIVGWLTAKPSRAVRHAGKRARSGAADTILYF